MQTVFGKARNMGRCRLETSINHDSCLAAQAVYFTDHLSGKPYTCTVFCKTCEDSWGKDHLKARCGQVVYMPLKYGKSWEDLVQDHQSLQ